MSSAADQPHHPACPARHDTEAECWCLRGSPGGPHGRHGAGVHRAAAALWPVVALLIAGAVLVWLMV